MSLLELSNPTTAGSEYFNIAKAQEKECKIVGMNIIDVLKENLKKSKRSEALELMIKILQDLKMERMNM